jgi:hypothetical protein
LKKVRNLILLRGERLSRWRKEPNLLLFAPQAVLELVLHLQIKELWRRIAWVLSESPLKTSYQSLLRGRNFIQILIALQRQKLSFKWLLRPNFLLRHLTTRRL